MKFEQIIDDKRGQMKVVCPKCKGIFGLDATFIDKIELVNYHFTCPYCGVERELN
jgi:predicted RNA-binding Zn-ribbon protein involved in translation (DUF1610 family)